MKIRIVRSWNWPDILRQTPHGLGRWEDYQFTYDSIEDPDYVVISNYFHDTLKVSCDPRCVWRIMQEPPVTMWQPVHEGSKHSNLVFTSDHGLDGSRYLHSHAISPWHVNKTYDELKGEDCPEKACDLSWITSDLRLLPIHKKRMEFLDILKKQIDFDLFGRGFQPIDDKWHGLAPYRYSIAVENYQGEWYWSEKLADCYLAWCMPIYCGCQNIDKYFPRESFIQIDISNPEESIDKIKEALQSELYKKNRDAIAYARELILDKYQFFPFIVNQIKAFESREGCIKSPKPLLMSNDLHPIEQESRQNVVRRIAGKVKKLLK